MNTLKPEYQQALGADFNLTDICHLSFDELRKKVKDKLSWSQTQSLYLEAQQMQKDNLLHEARILKRANPQLQSAVHLALTTPHADQQGYNSRFGNRASQYAAPGAISSMFSPAAYLTELYRQARNLHAEGSIYHLDTRRPDLKSLVLSQKNMDTEISTLSLSNNMLLNSIKTQTNLDSHVKVMEKLSTFRPSGSMPYHDAYESVRKIIQLQAPVFEQLNVFPETTFSQLKYQASLLDINASVSPELFTILTEEITESTAETLYKNNFGDIKPSLTKKLEYLKSYYNLSDEEFSDFLKIRTILLPEEEITITEPASHTTSTQQTIKKTDYRALLKINKFIRLFKAINLSPTVLSGILRSISPEFNINEEVLKKNLLY